MTVATLLPQAMMEYEYGAFQASSSRSDAIQICFACASAPLLMTALPPKPSRRPIPKACNCRPPREAARDLVPRRGLTIRSTVLCAARGDEW
jgi:hypothetical protein